MNARLHSARAFTRGAFTLLELMVGMMISTVILGAAASVFVTGLDSWERGSRVARTLQVAQTTADLIERHLRAAVPPQTDVNGIFEGEDLSLETQSGHRLLFHSAAEGRFPRSAPPSDVSEVEFELDPLLDGELTVRIDSSPDEEPEKGGYYVSLGKWVRSFEVVYYDGFEWVADWYESSLPLAIEFHVEVGDPADLDPQGEVRTQAISRLVWLPRAEQPAGSEAGLGDTLEGGTLESERGASHSASSTGDGDGGEAR